MEQTILLTPDEAAATLRLSRSKVYMLMATGELRSIKVGKSRRLLRRDVEAFAERQAQAASASA